MLLKLTDPAVWWEISGVTRAPDKNSSKARHCLHRLGESPRLGQQRDEIFLHPSQVERRQMCGRDHSKTTTPPKTHTHTYTHPKIHSQPRQVECSRLRRLPPLPAAEMETERRGERKKLKLHPTHTHTHPRTLPRTPTLDGRASLGKESQEHFLLRLSKKNNRGKVHSQEKKLKPSSQETSSFKK